MKISENNFKESLKNPESPVAIELIPDSHSMLIAFGGIIGSLVIPPFEFFNITRDFEINKIYIRDLNQSWYHTGIPQIAKDIDDICSFLRNAIKQSKSTKVVLIGNSMGGYAAILFGILLDMGTVHAFAPQTFLSRSLRFLHRDFRWNKQISKAGRIANKKYLDLRNLLKSSAMNCEINIHYSELDRLDKIHAKRLNAFPNTKIHSYSIGGHNTVKDLRDRGELKNLILKSLALFDDY